MAQNRVRNVPTFRAPSAYEEEMLRAQRQQQLAEMLRQQAFTPDEEPYTFQGFRATPSPANAIARVLSAYTAKKVGEKAEASERAAREADIAGAEEVLRGLGPQTRSVTGGALPETDVTGIASAYQPEMAQQPMMETVMPTAQERRDLLTQTMVRGTPMARQLAQFLAAQEPKTTTTEFGGQLLNVTGDTATPITMGGKPLSKPAKPKTPVRSTDFGGFVREYYNDGSYQDVKKTLAPSGPRDEPLMSIVGPDGKPVLARRSEAEGKQPFFATMAGGTQLTGDDKVDRRQFRAKRQELQNAYNSVLGFAKELKNTPKEESLFGEKAGRLASNYKLALGAVRVLQNTGVLNVGELPFIEDTLRNPQSISQLFNPASRETISGQIESILDLLEQQSSVNDEVYGYDVTPLKGRELRGEKIPAAAVKAGLTQADWDAATEEEKSAWR